ncbi:MAG TPA: group 1 truncated hemoglobin [Pseudomonas xinjiangensis]|uniref:Group 1 truncated hemoglobin n=2 Tax=root TaxID=1 RepID=A0A7V1FQT3_9GAMM|nr:group 1 truncated hemoglobin [Halopseudomonas xinjiangensis]HEC47537.1 group 1 truncated hemoglobin [Halopseudomonas xinjiangensis]
MRNMVILTLAIGLTACTTASQPSAPSTKADLYQELGGMPGIARIVEGMLINISEDSRIAHHFGDTDIDRLNEKLIEQICVESGGPCEYTGDSMVDSHTGLDITEGDFNALVENLTDAMEVQGVPTPAQNRLLNRLAPMRGDIIYR